jgi:hypothetical protein
MAMGKEGKAGCKYLGTKEIVSHQVVPGTQTPPSKSVLKLYTVGMLT